MREIESERDVEDLMQEAEALVYKHSPT